MRRLIKKRKTGKLGRVRERRKRARLMIMILLKRKKGN